MGRKLRLGSVDRLYSVQTHTVHTPAQFTISAPTADPDRESIKRVQHRLGRDGSAQNDAQESSTYGTVLARGSGSKGDCRIRFESGNPGDRFDTPPHIV